MHTAEQLKKKTNIIRLQRIKLLSVVTALCVFVGRRCRHAWKLPKLRFQCIIDGVSKYYCYCYIHPEILETIILFRLLFCAAVAAATTNSYLIHSSSTNLQHRIVYVFVTFICLHSRSLPLSHISAGLKLIHFYCHHDAIIIDVVIKLRAREPAIDLSLL